jgi:hypothetical protein
VTTLYSCTMMQLPIWLIAATPIAAATGLAISIVSLLTARASLRIARDTYYRAGPLILGSGRLAVLGGEVQADLMVRNAGLAAVNIEAVDLSYRENRRGAERVLPTVLRESDNVHFPYRLEPGTSVNFSYLVVRKNLFYLPDQRVLCESARRNYVNFSMQLANGSVVMVTCALDE